jgi:hypothetical protein
MRLYQTEANGMKATKIDKFFKTMETIGFLAQLFTGLAIGSALTGVWAYVGLKMIGVL